MSSTDVPPRVAASGISNGARLIRKMGAIGGADTVWAAYREFVLHDAIDLGRDFLSYRRSGSDNRIC